MMELKSVAEFLKLTAENEEISFSAYVAEKYEKDELFEYGKCFTYDEFYSNDFIKLDEEFYNDPYSFVKDTTNPQTILIIIENYKDRAVLHQGYDPTKYIGRPVIFSPTNIVGCIDNDCNFEQNHESSISVEKPLVMYFSRKK